MRTSNRVTRVAAAISVIGLALSLSACGPAATPQSKAAPAPQSNGTATPTSLTREEWEQEYTKCLAKEGVDMSFGGNKSVTMTEEEADAMLAANERCEKQLGEMPPLPEAQQAEHDAELLEFMRETAKCYRDNGYDVPDPKRPEDLHLPESVPDEIAEKCDGGFVTRVTVE
ncbi:hypothetical protein U6G28_06980 [Actinomycetaceae bacterium MB13-C1-2]|nr:hypothetical protein U6G28_06980 [Actinomycetaceae bacterium MB13-C1-2]